MEEHSLTPKLCKLVFTLSTPGLIHSVYSGYNFLTLNSQLGTAAFIFLLICPRIFSSGEAIFSIQVRFCSGVYATPVSDRVHQSWPYFLW